MCIRDRYLDSAGQTQLLSQTDAAALGLAAAGLQDLGARFATTTHSAFTFDPEGYLVANRADPGVHALVQSLAARFPSTASDEFVDAVEQHYLAHQAAHDSLLQGSAATAEDLNAVYGTVFFG